MDLELRKLVREPISTAELERRWSAVRGDMADQGIDCLIMQNSNEFMGGYVRWFTDIPAIQGYPITVLFPANDQMTMIAHGGRGAAPPAPQYLYRGVKERIPLPYFLSFNYTNTMDAEAAVNSVRARGVKRLGVVGPGFMSAAFYKYLENNLGGAELVDATDLVDEIKAIKSPEEIVLCRRACALQDATWAAVQGIARPGMREYEVRAELESILIGLGSEEQWIMIGSAEPGRHPRQRPNYLQTRTLQPGDQLNVMIEVNGPGGFWGELARTICFGDPPKELLEAWDLSVQAQALTVEKLRPGADPGEIFEAHNRWLEERGLPIERRVYAHGQGYDMVERPGIRPDEPMIVKANMNITVHPFVTMEKGYGYACDNFLVTESGNERMHKTPLEVFVAP